MVEKDGKQKTQGSKWATKKIRHYFPWYWMFNRDPYNCLHGLLSFPTSLGSMSSPPPTNPLNNQGLFFFTAQTPLELHLVLHIQIICSILVEHAGIQFQFDKRLPPRAYTSCRNKMKKLSWIHCFAETWSSEMTFLLIRWDSEKTESKGIINTSNQFWLRMDVYSKHRIILTNSGNNHKE